MINLKKFLGASTKTTAALTPMIQASLHRWQHVDDHLRRFIRRKGVLRFWSQLALFILSIVVVFMGFTYANAQQATCNTSGPGTYTVTLCLTTPINGATISGVANVAPSITITGSSTGVGSVVYTLNGQYLLTSVASPYSFDLPSTYYVDGAYVLAVQVNMRDGFATQLTSVNLTFSNGITTPPVNTNTFTPRTASAPPPGQSFMIAAVGDGAGGRPEAALVTNDIVARQPSLFLYLGDVYEKGTAVEFYNWYGTPNYFYGRFKASSNPVIGNHEYENGVAPGYFYYWDNIPNYYSYDAGGWHFIAINSTSSFGQTSTTSAQYQWLQQDLNQSTAKCTIAYWHEPLYNIGSQGEATRMASIWALLAQKQADLVLTGHDHNYQRWQPLDANGTPSSQGVTEIVAGMGGHGIRPLTRTDARVVTAYDNTATTSGTFYLALNPDGAEFRFINIYGTLLDYGVMPCIGAPVDTTVPTTPMNLTAPANANQEVILNWAAAWDNTGVLTYKILRDGVVINTVNGGTLSYTDQTANLGSTYLYTVQAVDPAGNQSAPSNAVTVITPTSRTVTLQAVADTYVDASNPTINYGSSTVLRSDNSPIINTYLRFNVPPLVGTVTSANLRLFANSSSSTGYSVRPVADNGWSETTLTYTTAPAFGNAIASIGSFASGNWTQVSVSSNLQINSLNSFAITSPSNTGISYSSRQGANPPELVINLVAAPTSTPTNTPTVTNTPLPTATATNTITPTNTPIPTDTPTATNTPIPTDTPTATNTPLPTATPTNTPTPTPTPLRLAPVADAYVDASKATKNFGTTNSLNIDSSPVQRAFLRFTLPTLTGTITSVKLRLNALNANSAGFTLYDVTNTTWGETTITANNAPANGTVIGSVPAVAAGAWSEIDVTNIVKSTGRANFVVVGLSSTVARYASREGVLGTRPELVIVTAAPGVAASEEPVVAMPQTLYLPVVVQSTDPTAAGSAQNTEATSSDEAPVTTTAETVSATPTTGEELAEPLPSETPAAATPVPSESTEPAPTETPTPTAAVLFLDSAPTPPTTSTP